MGFGEKFPRLCLCSRRSALGIGLMKPKTTLAILALKLYVGHKRLETNISTKIKINEQMKFLQDGYNSHPIETPSDNKIKNRTWTDEIGNVMSSRGMHFCNNDFEESIISKKTKR